MKKALVLGILAIFAIGISNVNAQNKDTKEEGTNLRFEAESHATESTPAVVGTLHSESINTNNTAVSNGQAVPCSNNHVGTAQGKCDNLGNDLNAIPPQQQDPKAPTNAQKREGKEEGAAEK